MISDKEGIQLLVSRFKAFGVQDIVICPGSRNAPMTISFHADSWFNCHSIADERSAGFYALGMILASKKPVAVVCTSGSAVINIGPAAAEAFYQRLPLIVVSADRPLEWVDQGNGQTIRQEGVLENHICDSFSLKAEPTNDIEQNWNIRKLDNALQITDGPIHINIPLREPLYHQVELNEAPDFRPPIKKFAGFRELDTSIKAEIKRVISGQKKILVLIGQSAPNHKLSAVVAELKKFPNTAVLTETTSNIEASGTISTIDRILMSINDRELLSEIMPDVLITMGGMLVSKVVKATLREAGIRSHIHFDEKAELIDTFQTLTHHIEAKAETGLALCMEYMGGLNSSYRQKWDSIKSIAQEAHNSYTARLPYSDFQVFSKVLDGNLDFQVLHLANSSPVRYAQLFGQQKGIEQFANRGTSGIDGSTSTASGFAKRDPKRSHLIITGDMSFCYDVNALWNREFPENLKVLVINNSGGGIFRIIKGPDTTAALEPFFDAHHPVDIQSLAKAYGFTHIKADSEANLTHQLAAFNQASGKVVLEVATPKAENAAVLKNYFKYISEALTRQYSI